VKPFGKHLTTWADSHFKVELFDCGPTDEDLSRTCIGYRFYDHFYDHNGPPIFEGDDYQVAACTPPASHAAVLGLLHFLSLKPGDTDDEYFQSYTERQLGWRDSQRRDDLELLVIEFDCSGEHG
jgi:hypothetical protein